MEFKPIASSSEGCAYLLTSNGLSPLLIDCGVRFDSIQQATGFRLGSLAGCLISHSHGDHIKAAGKLLVAGVNCYASRETWEAYASNSQHRPHHHHRQKAIDTEHDTLIGQWTVRAFECVHDTPGTLGFVIADGQGNKLLYLTDSAYSKYRFSGLTHIAVECNWSETLMRQNAVDGAIEPSRASRTIRNHMSLERLIGMLQANDLSKVQEIHLLHLSDANSDEVEFKEAIQKATGKPVYVAAKAGSARMNEVGTAEEVKA